MGELDIGAADYLDSLNNVIGIFLKALPELRSYGKHRRSAIGITGVDPHGIYILYKTDGNHLIFCIAHHFKLKFLPSENRLLNQHLTNKTCCNASTRNGSQLLYIVDQAASGTSHGVCRTDDYRITKLAGDCFSFLYSVCRFTRRHINTELFHSLLECYAVFAALDGIGLHSDDLDPIPVEHACTGQFCGEIKSGLTSEIGE